MKLELKENMYYRTYSGSINKITSIKDYNEREYLLNGFYINKDTIKKVSYNIIDILEVGDYVNGYKVSAIYNPNGDEIVNITLIMEYGYETINTYIDDYSINSIVTKEQFEQMAYKVGE